MQCFRCGCAMVPLCLACRPFENGCNTYVSCMSPPGIVIVVCFPCLCRVFAVLLLQLCRDGFVSLSCLCCAFALYLQCILSRGCCATCVGCGSALRWVVDCPCQACVRVCLGRAVRWPRSRYALGVCFPNSPVRNASRARHVLPCRWPVSDGPARSDLLRASPQSQRQ